MVDENDDDVNSFDESSDPFTNTLISSTTSLNIDIYSKNENNCSGISINKILQSKPCYYNKLPFMDFVLKNMHKRWSVID